MIRSWTPTGVALPAGVGYTGNVWLSDTTSDRNFEFTVEGRSTGRSWPTPWVGTMPFDMAYDTTHGLMCQVNVGGDNGIYCWDPDTGEVVDSITGSFPWTTAAQRGLAYRAEDDTFYIGGVTQGILYQVKGLSYPDKGAVISQCIPPNGEISGLAYNPSFKVVWAGHRHPRATPSISSTRARARCSVPCPTQARASTGRGWRWIRPAICGSSTRTPTPST